ncbi:hypothetical protein CALVIDRAFT_552509 [Calocera viscosa TUFC12733]|uniref:Uncharacterized protein n=1 Tax=Calocera viscosa (strain TUFC12733) TaxID=1330018 RepID=A0A167RDY0_CALVF|nr:hypothetical protein CALVIDRAFT_552509 [Calocera viscosa TUFC12733]
MSMQLYNISLGEESPTFQYTPVRDGPVTEGWNSSYSGNIEWSGLEGSPGIGTPYRRTELDGAGFTLAFHGTALYLCLTTNSGAGYTLTIDNNAVTKTASASDQACSNFFPGSEVLVVADGLTYGSHTAEFNATISGTGASVDFYGGLVSLGAGPPGAIVTASPLVVDDRNPAWVYEPWPWIQGTGTGEYDGTHSYACPYNPSVTASLTFNGSSIVQLIGTLTSNVFGYSVEFDNVETVYNGTNYWWATQQTMFFAGGLDPTQSYTLTLIDYDANQPNGPPGLNTSGFLCVNLDAVLLVQATLPNTQSTSSISGTATSPSSGASHSSGADTGGNGQSGGGLSGGAIAGIVIGALAVLALIIAVWFLLSRMRKRAAAPGGSGQAVFTHSYRGSTPHPPDPIPYITPVQSSFTSDAPVSSVSGGGAALAAGYRTEKSPRSIPNNAAYGGVRSIPGPLSEGGTSSSSDPRLTNEILQNAPTVDLVTILNQRLRREQADNIEEPPTYG